MLLSSRMPELASFEVLLAIAKTGSLGAAAREVGLTQQAASARLASMEAQTGVQLAVHTTKDGGFFEVLVDQATGQVSKSEPLTEANSLSIAQSQNAAMANAKISLKEAVDKTFSGQGGVHAVGVIPSRPNAVRNPAQSLVSVSSRASKGCPTHSKYNFRGLAGEGHRTADGGG